MGEQLKYNRVILKLSGEALSRQGEFGINAEMLSSIAQEIAGVASLGVELAVVVGGGNLLRGAAMASTMIERSTADYMGMLATAMNALALRDAIESHGGKVTVMSSIPMDGVLERWSGRRCVQLLTKGQIVILATGTGSPFVTTDSCAALRSAELQVDALLKATKVDGIYTGDPKKDPNARRYDVLSYGTFIENRLRALDLTAVAICMENRIPVILFNLFEKGNIERVIRGATVGTTITE